MLHFAVTSETYLLAAIRGWVAAKKNKVDFLGCLRNGVRVADTNTRTSEPFSTPSSSSFEADVGER